MTYVNNVADTTRVPGLQLLVPRGQHPRQAPGVHGAASGYPPYVEKCDEVAAKGYDGFAISLPPDARPADLLLPLVQRYIKSA